MPLVRTMLRPVSLLIFGTVLGAQVFVVDAAGGAGSHFTDLPAAVATVPDGSTLRVRAGIYTGFVIDGKGLSIVGEGTVQVTLTTLATPTPIIVRRTASSQPTLLQGLWLTVDFPYFRTAVEIRGTSGPVILDSVRCMQLDVDFVVDAAANVLFHQCSLASSPLLTATTQPRIRVVDSTLELSSCNVVSQSQPLTYPFPTYDGTPAMTLFRSRCILTNSTLLGGLGNPGCNAQAGPFRCFITPPGNGGVGVAASASTLIARGSTISGANGHNQWLDSAGVVPASNGGDGLRLAGGSRAILLKSPVSAGRGGLPNGLAGQTTVVDASSTLTSDPMAFPTNLELRGTFTRGSVVEFIVRGAPNTPAVMLLSYRADVVPLEPLAIGSMLAAPAVVVGPFSTQAWGEVRLTLPLTQTWPLGETYFAQAMSLEPGRNVIWPSNRVALHVNH